MRLTLALRSAQSPIISFLLLVGLMMPLSACDFGGGEAEQAPGNTEQKEDDDDDD